MGYTSETATARDRLAQYCVGNGVDLGFGGDPIVPHAICVDRQPGHQIRANCGSHPTHFVCDVRDLYWLKDQSIDFCYNAHVLEDMVDTEAVLREWIRVLKPRGRLVMFLPDEQIYRAHCARTGQPYNMAHIHASFGLKFVQDILDNIGLTRTIYSHNAPTPNNVYSFDHVSERLP